MSPPTRRFAVLAVSVALPLSACASSGDAAVGTIATTTPPTEPTTPPPTSTTSTTTTSTITTSTTTTEAPTTTLDPIANADAEIQAALSEGERKLSKAFADPNSGPARDVLDDYFTEGSLTKINSALDQLVAEGLVGRDNPVVPQVVVLRSPPEPIPGSGDVRMAARLCRVDAETIYLPSPDRASGEIIVNDTVRRTVSMSEFVLEDGRWKLAGGRELSNTVGATTCTDT